MEAQKDQFIKHLQKHGRATATQLAYSKDIEQLKVKYLGKKGPIQGLMVELRNVDPAERPRIGKVTLPHLADGATNLRNHRVFQPIEPVLKRPGTTWARVNPDLHHIKPVTNMLPIQMLSNQQHFIRRSNPISSIKLTSWRAW